MKEMKFKIGDIIRINWFDAHSGVEREKTWDKLATDLLRHTLGIVISENDIYVVVAHSMDEKNTDNITPEIEYWSIPKGCIHDYKIYANDKDFLDKTKLIGKIDATD